MYCRRLLIMLLYIITLICKFHNLNYKPIYIYIYIYIYVCIDNSTKVYDYVEEGCYRIVPDTKDAQHRCIGINPTNFMCMIG